MPRRNSFIRAAVAALSLAACPQAALAAHGKVGLWQITIKSNLGSMIPPAQMAKMRAMGLNMPASSTFSVQHCMTAQEVAMDKPPPMTHGKECAVQNVKMTAQGFSSDTVCSGAMQGTGHAQVSFNSAEHYAGKVSFTGTAHGHPANMTMTIDGKWTSPVCGKVMH